MTDFLVTVIKVLFLALLWLFILSAAHVIRSDLYGREVSAKDIAKDETAPRKPLKVRKRGKPTHLALLMDGKVHLTYQLGDYSLDIGRDPACAVHIDEQFASGRHAVVQPSGINFVVEDLQSTNGTYVNEGLISEPTLLTTKDLIRIGRTELKLVSMR
ncbi:MAG: FHA domain-containing protein [Propionibacteriales bacterium]|nr:MAG: FHA domain-containing protein [Propionibacteriales bacterium]